jgi:hypothetical protein
MELKTIHPPVHLILLTEEEENTLWKAVQAANGKPFKFKDVVIDIFWTGRDGHEDCLLIHGETKARIIRRLES